MALSRVVSPRWTVAALTILLVVGSVIASRNGLFVTAVPGTPVASAVHEVDVPADRAIDVRVDDRWSIHIPAGGVREDSTLTIQLLSGAGGPVGSTPLAAAVLELSSGQPAAPWTFTWRHEQPLPTDQVLYLLDDAGDGAAYGVRPIQEAVTSATASRATMSPDRRVGTIQVSHLSFLQWLSDAAGVVSNAIGKFFGHRSNPPDCRGNRPEWLSEAVFLEDRNAPMLVCVGGDPNRPDLAVVKVVNNRGGALLVTAPVVPEWAWQSFVGKEMEAWVPNLLTHVVEYLGVPKSDLTRTWILPPGQEVDLGFSRASLGSRSPAEVVGTFSSTSIVLGLASKAVSEVLDENSRGWDFIVMGACLESMGARVVDDHSAAGVAQGMASLARCVVEQPETLIQVLRKLVPQAVWQGMSGKVFRVANLAKKALTRYLAVAEVTFVIADLTGTLTLPRSAFTISLFPRPEPVKTRVVTVVGVARTGGPAPDFAVEVTNEQVDGCTSSPASTNPDIVACFPHAASADICWVQSDRITLLCGGMPWEKKLYQYISDQPVASAPAADYEVSPWGLELANGFKCRLRNGGAWGGRADGYIGAYFCGDQPQVVLAGPNEPLIDKNGTQWTVKIGEIGGDGDTFPPPTAMAVTTVYYAGMP